MTFKTQEEKNDAIRGAEDTLSRIKAASVKNPKARPGDIYVVDAGGLQKDTCHLRFVREDGTVFNGDGGRANRFSPDNLELQKASLYKEYIGNFYEIVGMEVPSFTWESDSEVLDC